MMSLKTTHRDVKITVYRWAGKKWFLRIRGECIECDLVIGQARHLLSAHPDWPLELEIKPWLTYLWETLRHGGWHPPVILVDGRLVRQGTIPTRAELEAAVRRALVRRNHPQSPQQGVHAAEPPRQFPGHAVDSEVKSC